MHVELKDVSRSFGGARALEAVSLQISRGSIHALVGENGAGKSTLGKIVSGVIPPDHGQVLLGGEPVHFHSPRAAIARGIVLIAQELSLVPALTVAENVFLGTEPRRAGFLRRRALRRRYTELAASAGFGLPAEAPAGSLRTADQQKVEILRALSRDAGLIVMDEPTAALSRPDVVKLHEIIRRLAQAGTTIVLVSHFLGEVLELADEVTILRDGRLVRTTPAAGQTEESLLDAMLGRSLGATFPARQPVTGQAPVVLSVTGLTAPGVENVSLDVRAGEIVGLAGLVGAGRSELAHAVYRASRAAAGTVQVADGPALGGRRLAAGPRSALDAGVAMIPESRKDQGLLLGRSIAENVSLASLASDPTNAPKITVTATFNEAVTGFDIASIAAENASAGNLTGSGASYTFDLTPAGQGMVKTHILAAAAHDAAGNSSLESSVLERTYDSLPPSLLNITREDTSPTRAGSVKFALRFDEPGSGVDTSDLALTVNGRISGQAGLMRKRCRAGTPLASSIAISSNNAVGDSTTPLPIRHCTLSRRMPEGISLSMVFSPSMTSVCPALWPP